MAAVYTSYRSNANGSHARLQQRALPPSSVFLDDCAPSPAGMIVGAPSGATAAALAGMPSGNPQAVRTLSANEWSSLMQRTDMFPGLDALAPLATDECAPSPAHLQKQSPSAFLAPFGAPRLISATVSTTPAAAVANDVVDVDTSVDGLLDFSGSIAAASELDGPAVSSFDWSPSSSASSHTSAFSESLALPPTTSAVSLKREDSLGKALGVDALPDIDAAPVPVSSFVFDVAPASSPVSGGSASLGFGAFDSALEFSSVAPLSFGARPVSSFVSVPMVKDEEPDASSVTDVDAASDAWSVPSSPLSTYSSPSSPALVPSMTHRVRAKKEHMSASTAHVAVLDSAAALRVGPYNTRGRAAALAVPTEQGPKELKPVPVARGPHAGLLGGGEMASIGIYTKEDRWRKIERLREKRRARIVVKTTGGQYACRKSFADRRPRIGGRFVKMDEETKRFLSLTKPGATPPPNLSTPAALRQYAAQQAAHQQKLAVHAAHPGTGSYLAQAARAASVASATMPLFGSMAPPVFPTASVGVAGSHWNYTSYAAAMPMPATAMALPPATLVGA